MEITKLTALDLGRKIKVGEITAIEAVKAQFEKIKSREESYNTYITLMEEEALKRAEDLQKKITAGELKNSPLAGVPVAIKDNICIKGVKTTCASKMLYNYIPPYNAEVIDRLEGAGAIIIGKSNMDEFAMGSNSETSYFGSTKNPWNESRVPGGSSGGSAATVAAEEAFYALGTDTGGSIRQPSSFCGVTGIKPTYGTISRYGLIAYASSLDQIGPIGRNVSDCVAALEILSGYDKKDSSSMKREDYGEDYDFSKALRDDIKGMKIGIPREYIEKGLDEEVKKSILDAAKVLEDKGADIEVFDMDILNYGVPAYYVIACAEASSNLSRFDGIKYGFRIKEFDGLSDLYKKTRNEAFGIEVKRRILIGSFVLSSGYYDEFYKKALKVRTKIKHAFEHAFEKYDVILGPSAATTAPPFGENSEDPLKAYLGDIYTVSVNLAGLPAMSLPCGMDRNGLPIGLQLIGKAFGEKDIIRVAYSFEKTRQYMSPIKD